MNPAISQIADVGSLPAEVRPTRMNKADVMSMGRGIRSNLAWMVGGTVWSGACQWGLLVALAKIGTVDMVGAFTLGVAIAFPILMFSCLNLRSLYVTDLGAAYRFREYVALRLFMSAMSVALTAALALMAHSNRNLTVAVVFIGTAKAIEYVSDILYGLLQRQESMAAMSISMMLRGTLSLCALSLGVYMSGSLIWGAFGLVLSSVFTLLVFDVPVSLSRLHLSYGQALREFAAYGRTLFGTAGREVRRLRSLAISGVPLGLVLMLVSLNVSIPRYFVEQSLGIREQGIFSSLANLISVGSVVILALGVSATPRLAKYFSSRDMRSFLTLMWILVLFSVSLGAAGLTLAATLGRQTLTLLYRPEYAARQDIFVWLMAASGAIYLGSTMGVALTAARCLTPQLPLFAFAAAVTALSCYLLVPSLGLRGAAISIFASAVVQSAGGALLLRNACNRASSAAASA